MLSRANRLRSEGKLQDAAEIYAQILEAQPDFRPAIRFLDSLNQNAPKSRDVAQVGFELAPFTFKLNFLPQHIFEGLHHKLENTRSGYVAGDTTSGQHLDIRRTHVIGEAGDVIGDAALEDFYMSLSSFWRNEEHALRGIDLDVVSLEAQATLYTDGGFYKPHRDIGPNNTRRMTFVYYLFTDPRDFSGGDLLLYDTNIVDSVEPHQPRSDLRRPMFTTTYTRISPQANSLVIFPSEYFHEVSEMKSNNAVSGERYSLTGWLHTSPDKATMQVIRDARY